MLISLICNNELKICNLFPVLHLYNIIKQQAPGLAVKVQPVPETMITAKKRKKRSAGSLAMQGSAPGPAQQAPRRAERAPRERSELWGGTIDGLFKRGRWPATGTR